MEDNWTTTGDVQEYGYYGQLSVVMTMIGTTTYSDYIRDFDELEAHSKKCYGHRNKIYRVTLTGPGLV